LSFVITTDAPQTGYSNVGASSLDVTQLILVPRRLTSFNFVVDTPDRHQLEETQCNRTSTDDDDAMGMGRRTTRSLQHR
jgi:hypothetical protein